MYSMDIDMGDAFNEICNKKSSIQDENPTDAERFMPCTSVFVCCRLEANHSVRLYRYSILADSFDVIDVDLANRTVPHSMHYINGQIYMFSHISWSGQMEVKRAFHSAIFSIFLLILV